MGYVVHAARTLVQQAIFNSTGFEARNRWGLTHAGDELHVGIRVGEAEPAAVDGAAGGQRRGARAVGSSIHENFPAHEVRPMQRQRPLHCLWFGELYVPEAVESACSKNERLLGHTPSRRQLYVPRAAELACTA